MTQQRRKKKDKRGNKEKKGKTINEKKEFIKLIKIKIGELKLNEDNEAVNKLYNILDEYLNLGYSASGTIKMDGLDRTIHYVLSNQIHIENKVFIKYDK